MYKKDIQLLLFITANFFIYLILSFMMNINLFKSETDGFFYQIMGVADGKDLGVLSVVHQARYIVIYPLVKLQNFNLTQLQPLFLTLYLIPILMLKIPNHVKIFSLLLLYCSLFFSYRTIIVMLSIYILILHIKYNVVSKKLILLSMLYSLLSSGAFLFWFLLVVFYKDKFIKNRYILKYSFFVFLLLFSLAIGPMMHKILFFIDPHQFGSATSVTYEILSNVSISDIKELFSNIINRSMVIEAYHEKNFIRLYILFFLFIVFLFLFLVIRNRFIYVIFTFFLISLLFEGLMAYSLFFSVLFLFYDYFYRNLKGLYVVKKNIN